MNFLKAIILSLILIAPVGVSTSLVIFDDDREYEVLQNLSSEEEEDERGPDETLEEADFIPNELLNTEFSDQTLIATNHQITYRNRYFISLIPEVLTPPPEKL